MGSGWRGEAEGDQREPERGRKKDLPLQSAIDVVVGVWGRGRVEAGPLIFFGARGKGSRLLRRKCNAVVIC